MKENCGKPFEWPFEWYFEMKFGLHRLAQPAIRLPESRFGSGRKRSTNSSAKLALAGAPAGIMDGEGEMESGSVREFRAGRKEIRNGNLRNRGLSGKGLRRRQGEEGD
jgi:hypothetical protein